MVHIKQADGERQHHMDKLTRLEINNFIKYKDEMSQSQEVTTCLSNIDNQTRRQYVESAKGWEEQLVMRVDYFRHGPLKF